MRNLLRKVFNGAAFATGLIGFMYMVNVAMATIAPFTGVQGSNPILGIPATQVDFNTLISSINAQIGSYLAFNQTNETGEAAFVNSGSWVANGTVATTMTSLGPGGSHTTIQEWLVVVDNNGTPRYVPAY